MIKFFRKIRQRLLVDLPAGEAGNRISKYLLYAIGEIILVVIGILIALQINNWNEDRNERALEDHYLKQIHTEFLSNQEQFDLVLKAHKRSYYSCLWILANYQNPDLNEDTLRWHLNRYRWSFTYNPSNSAINAILNSGNLNIIKDKELRDALVKWNEMVKDYSEEELRSRTFLDEIIVPFEIDHFQLYQEPKHMRFDKFFAFDQATLNEFLNMVAVKRRLLYQIVENPEAEYALISESIDLIIRKSARDF